MTQHTNSVWPNIWYEMATRSVLVIIIPPQELYGDSAQPDNKTAPFQSQSGIKKAVAMWPR